MAVFLYQLLVEKFQVLEDLQIVKFLPTII
jgi:hypothetical protein